MKTPRRLPLVSLTLSLALASTGCASLPAPLADEEPVLAAATPTTIRFENRGRDHVHVYLVDERHQWLLGRVEAGARTTLRIPEPALAEYSWTMRLAVLTGERVGTRVASSSNAATMIAEPITRILSQGWAFSQSRSGGQLVAIVPGRPVRP